MYIVIVPAARVVVGIVGDCPHCSNAPQCLNLSERWDAKERRRQQFSCVPFQRETWQCWHASAQGQVGGLWTAELFHIFKSSCHLSKASPGACQSLLRGFNLAFLKLYGWSKASCGPQAVGIERDESTCIQDCRKGRSSAWPSPSWRAAEPPGILLSKP